MRTKDIHKSKTETEESSRRAGKPTGKTKEAREIDEVLSGSKIYNADGNSVSGKSVSVKHEGWDDNNEVYVVEFSDGVIYRAATEEHAKDMAEVHKRECKVDHGETTDPEQQPPSSDEVEKQMGGE